jgi:hypothetical protein
MSVSKRGSEGPLLAVVTTILPAIAAAHHATAPTFDQGRVVELTGEITDVRWRNPHITLTLRSDDASATTDWHIETNSVSIVSRFGLTPELIAPGTHVRVAGNPGRRDPNALWLTNVLLDDGREILFGSAYLPRWSEDIIGADTRGAITADPTGALGIFRVWTSIGGGGALWNNSYPLTPEAAAARAAFDPLRDSPTLGCRPKGMPLIMEQPYPMEIADEGEQIVMRLEEYDTVRTIELANPERVTGRPASLLGNSVGHWEGDVLVVETTAIDYPWFDKTGIPQSEALRTVERFTLTRDGSRLDYEMTVTDPGTFTEPVVLTKSWGYRPNDRVRPYECSEAG